LRIALILFLSLVMLFLIRGCVPGGFVFCANIQDVGSVSVFRKDDVYCLLHTVFVVKNVHGMNAVAVPQALRRQGGYYHVPVEVDSQCCYREISEKQFSSFSELKTESDWETFFRLWFGNSHQEGNRIIGVIPKGTHIRIDHCKRLYCLSLWYGFAVQDMIVAKLVVNDLGCEVEFEISDFIDRKTKGPLSYLIAKDPRNCHK